MTHIVKEKERIEKSEGFGYKISMAAKGDSWRWSILNVSEDEYNAVEIGQEVEVMVDPIFAAKV